MCIYVCIYMCIYVYICVYMCVCVYACMCVCICLWARRGGDPHHPQAAPLAATAHARRCIALHLHHIIASRRVSSDCPNRRRTERARTFLQQDDGRVPAAVPRAPRGDVRPGPRSEVRRGPSGSPSPSLSPSPSPSPSVVTLGSTRAPRVRQDARKMLAGVLPANYAWLARDMIIAGLESAATTAAARAQAQPPDNGSAHACSHACARACLRLRLPTSDCTRPTDAPAAATGAASWLPRRPIPA
jgi:hypothetical protein